ncbi:MAG: YcbK family protein [Deltaproteobacteria bacterium]|nr:YcbK family protein [Deltaproteobacteria bacterium]
MASLLAALLFMIYAQFARATDTGDPEQQAAEPEEGNYYGRRGERQCREGESTADYRLKVATLRMVDETVPEPQWVDGFRELRLRAAHGGETITVVPFDESGELTSEAAAQVTDVFCGTRSACDVAVDPRLVRVLYVLALHFEAREIVIVSGIRLPEEDGRTSNHHAGRAADIIVPGVPNEEVASYAREFGRLGVGVYPVSGFTHVDVRERSFFWTDSSGPGEPICTVGILPDVAREVDELYDEAFEDPRTWSPVPMPPEPEDPGARPEGDEDRLDELDDEALVGSIFDEELEGDLRVATREAGRGGRGRAATTASSEPSRGLRSAAGAAPESRSGASEVEPAAPETPQASSNTMSPPTTVATALPGTS